MKESEINTDEYWFRAKRYGWGWGLPATWQGWIVFVVFLSSVLLTYVLFPPGAKPISFGVMIMFSSLWFFLICLVKGEPPKWRWGDKD